MSSTEHDAKTPSTRTGAAATRRGPLGTGGSGACPLGLLTLLAVLAALLLASTASAAEPIHPLIGPFGTAAQPTFGAAAGMTVDPPTGDLHVIDPVPA
ncbi:MAG TPA: hypothetical protein VHU86_08720 [Solirubrobacterales bacterium]|nr:hypothetical protein [Solirubrobacterales bacterium]